MNRCRQIPCLASVLAALLLPVAGAAAAPVVATLNGLDISIDAQSGAVLGMSYSGPGKILDATPDRAGLVDVAYPVDEFEPLRLASRFSQGAQIEKSDDAVVITLPRLGASRKKFQSAGNVSAKVMMRAMPDGRSISLACEIENASDRPVRQILFPDLRGLLPVGGTEGTYLRSPGFVRRPFVEVGMTDYPEFYALDDQTRPIDRRDTYLYTGGQNIGDGDRMIGRWLDFGGLKGGISIFPEQWAGDPTTKVRIFRLQSDPNVRLAHVHDGVNLKKGQTWKSPTYILTPHRDGWARGIETYRDFIKGKVHRAFPIPEHVRKGLGFRTAIMGMREPNDDERNVAFAFTDLPRLGAECRDNGLDELVLWAWRPGFRLPDAQPWPDLGTPEQLAAGIRECNKLGVNVSLFISIFSASAETAPRYGLEVGNTGWTYHPEFIPRFNPPYARGNASVVVDPTNEQWQKDVMVDVRHLYDQYTHSLTWDQAWKGTEAVFRQFLPLVKSSDPRATFSGEITQSAELLTDWLDYTWNWEVGSYHHNLMKPYRDMRAFNAAFPAPRLNYNINHNAQHVKYAFMDNFYLNVMPSAPDKANATGWIHDDPALVAVLKQCGTLRRQFLPYFTDGTLIGECLLTRPADDGTHVNAYVLPDRVLLMIMNTRDETRGIDFTIDLAPWLKSSSGDACRVETFDQHGQALGAAQTVSRDWKGKTPSLAPFDMAIYQFTTTTGNR